MNGHKPRCAQRKPLVSPVTVTDDSVRPVVPFVGQDRHPTQLQGWSTGSQTEFDTGSASDAWATARCTHRTYRQNSQRDEPWRRTAQARRSGGYGARAFAAMTRPRTCGSGSALSRLVVTAASTSNWSPSFSGIQRLALVENLSRRNPR